MASSSRFGSTTCNYSPYSDSVSLRLHLNGLTLLHIVTRRLIMQKVRRSGFTIALSSVCKYMVSNSISLPLSGFFSSFPHGTSSLSVSKEYFGLEGGPPRFRQDFTCPVLLRIPASHLNFRIRDFHSLWCAFPNTSPNLAFPYAGPTTPACKHTGLASSAFARRY